MEYIQICSLAEIKCYCLTLQDILCFYIIDFILFFSIFSTFFLALFLHHWSKWKWEVQCDRLNALCVWIQSSKDQVEKALSADSQL